MILIQKNHRMHFSEKWIIQIKRVKMKKMNILPYTQAGIVEYLDDEPIRVPRGDITTSSHIMTNLFLNNDTFYSMCNQLNKKQKNLFYFVSKHIQQVKDGLEPDPFLYL